MRNLPNYGKSDLGPPQGRIRRAISAATNAWLRLYATLQGASIGAYVAVATLVGADLFAMLIASAAIWPVGIPLLLATVGLVYWGRRALRRGRHKGRL